MVNRDIQADDLALDRTGVPGKSLSSHVPMMICFGIPAAILISAYLYMAVFYQKLWLFDTVVHENGKYTLLEVIFYFKHFSWEMLIKSIYALFIVGAFYYYGNPSAADLKDGGTEITLNHIMLPLLILASLITLTIIATASEWGLKETVQGLSQYKTSETRPPVFGSHWRNHFLSNIVFFSSSAVVVMLHRILYCGSHWQKRKHCYLLHVSIGIFIVLTLVFGFTTDPFKTPSYLGHQLREIFGSDLPITMLLAMGVLIYLEKKFDSREMRNSVKRKKQTVNIRHLTILCIISILPVIFLIIKVLSLNISSEITGLGETSDWSVLDLFAWHFFEHCLDYVWVSFLVSFFYLITLKTDLGRTIGEK